MAENGSFSMPKAKSFHYLYCVEFAGKRAMYPELMKFVMGRSSSSEFVITSLRVSAKHCEIICSTDGWRLHNLTCLPLGTLLNGKVIIHDETVPLEDEAILKLGNVYMQCRMETDLVPYKLPLRILKLQAIIGEEFCTLSPEPEINTCRRDMNQCHSNEDDSIIEILPNQRSQKRESSENGSMSLESRGKRHIVKELEETKAALRQALVAKGEMELELAEIKQAYASSKSRPKEATKIEEVVEQELQCSICNELLTDAVTLNCSHTFCEICLMEWKKKSKVCPLCRQPFSAECKTRIVDNFIERVIENLPEDVQNRRKELTESRKAMKRPASERKKSTKRRRVRSSRPIVRVSVDYTPGLDDTIYISDEDL